LPGHGSLGARGMLPTTLYSVSQHPQEASPCGVR
jgi:hypothetical protein